MRRSRGRVKTEVADNWLTHDSAVETDWAVTLVRLALDPSVKRPR